MPKIVDHDLQRAELLEAAFDLFADHGYASLSMRQLAAGLGVSTGTLYHYFTSKDDIFEQMVARISARDVSAAVADIPDAAGPAERLGMIYAWIRSNEAYLRRVLLLIFDFQRHRQDPQAVALVQGAARVYRRVFEQQVGAAPGTWMLILGLLVQGILEPELVDSAAPLPLLQALVAQEQNLLVN